MKHFTVFNFKKLTEEEKALNELLQLKKEKESQMPSQQSVDNILAYSKSLSVRKSKHLGFLENVLN
ncbi:MAG: hypothetical protein RJQ00_08400 [Vicingaceae bacterium]